MLERFDFIIVGGGIFGVMLAAEAAALGLRPLVLRLSDRPRPRAETVRNQGWLQSGATHRFRDFPSRDAFREFGQQAYFFGRDTLKECGLPTPAERGLLITSDPVRIAELHEARALLRFPEDEFRQLEPDESQRLGGEHWDPGAAYFYIPDAPFDEASVLEYYRAAAKSEGAVFLNLEEPARLSRVAGGVRVAFDGYRIDAPLVVVAAGAGSFGLMAGYGVTLNGSLQRTPLRVAEAPPSMPAPVMVDSNWGWSGVRHFRAGDSPAIVMGTRVNCKNVAFADAFERNIPEAKKLEFMSRTPPPFDRLAGRFTAGYEVVPAPGVTISRFSPWIEAHGDVIFGSPGRATTAKVAVNQALVKIMQHRIARPGKTTPFDRSECREWDELIEMHFMGTFDFDDGEGNS